MEKTFILLRSMLLIPKKEDTFNIHFMSDLVIILDFRKRFTMLRCLISIQSKE